MEFFSLEAEEDGFHLQFSDNKIENTEIDVTNFINEDPIEEEDVIFYRQLNPLDINDYPKFNGQVRNPIEAIYSDDKSYFGEAEQPELFAPENRDNVTFDKFEGYEKSVEKFKKTLHNFYDIENHLFNAVIYGLMFYKQKNYQQLADVKPKKKMLNRF